MQRVLHPLPLRIMHWVNAVTIIIMIGSGWKIYNDEVLFGWLHFPEYLTLGKWAQHGLQWHFFGMWILVINGLSYLTYGLFTGRFRRMLLPIRFDELIETIKEALQFNDKVIRSGALTGPLQRDPWGAGRFVRVGGKTGYDEDVFSSTKQAPVSTSTYDNHEPVWPAPDRQRSPTLSPAGRTR